MDGRRGDGKSWYTNFVKGPIVILEYTGQDQGSIMINSLANTLSLSNCSSDCERCEKRMSAAWRKRDEREGCIFPGDNETIIEKEASFF